MVQPILNRKLNQPVTKSKTLTHVDVLAKTRNRPWEEQLQSPASASYLEVEVINFALFLTMIKKKMN